MQKLGNLCSRVLAFLWNFIPWRLDAYLAKSLAFVWIDVFGIRQDVIYQNLENVFPGMNESQKRIIAKKSMVSLCRSFFDVIRIPYLTESWIQQNVVFENEALFKKIQEDDTGVFFLSLHVGSGDLAGAIVSRTYKPITLISKRFTNLFMDSFWFGLRERASTLFINAHSKNNAFEILAALKKKRGVVFVLDQFMGKPYGAETQFFGITTGTAYGLALFAKKTTKPVYPLYTYWLGDKLHICVDEAVDLSAHLSETNEVITNKFNEVLEKIILRLPEHWMWVHKRWKTFE
ncbi:MAG: lysophospholipid acyltransferase family protein [Pseudobdellovibrio sp.]